MTRSSGGLCRLGNNERAHVVPRGLVVLLVGGVLVRTTFRSASRLHAPPRVRRRSTGSSCSSSICTAPCGAKQSVSRRRGAN